jgi:hypothetical protein
VGLPPWLLLAFLIAFALALAYHLANARSGWRVLVYWALILIALLGAEVFSESVGWNFTRLGDLRVAPDLIAALGVICILWLLGL